MEKHSAEVSHRSSGDQWNGSSAKLLAVKEPAGTRALRNLSRNLHNFLNKYSCQESTIVSGGKYPVFRKEHKRYPAPGAHLALSETSL